MRTKISWLFRCKIYFVFFISVVCANHENIFTMKISRSTVCGVVAWWALFGTIYLYSTYRHFVSYYYYMQSSIPPLLSSLLSISSSFYFSLSSQGTWAPRKIDNPAHFEDKTPFFSLSPIGAIGFELWTMNENIYFDNVIITSELTVANNYAAEG